MSGPRTWPRVVATRLPVLGAVELSLSPVAGNVLVSARTLLGATPALALTPDDCLTLAQELLHAAARAHELTGALAPHGSAVLAAKGAG